MNWLILLYFIELGYSPFYTSLNVTPVDQLRITNEAVYYISLGMEIFIFNNLFIGGAVKTYYQNLQDKLSYHPFEVD